MPRKRVKKADGDISSLKVVDLRKELLSMGLDTTGNKAQLVARLDKATQDSPSLKKTKVETTSTCTSTSCTATISVSAMCSVDYSKMSVADLVKELKCKGLSTKGKKDDLIRRLETTNEGSLSNEEKSEEAAEEVDLIKAKEALATKVERTKESLKIERKSDSIDSYWEVFEDWDCVLVQNNISKNANNFYIIQLLYHCPNAILWTRWGRVGEPGRSNMGNGGTIDNVKEVFKRKFFDKTGNKWEDKDNFRSVPGKFSLVEIDDESQEDEHQTSVKLAAMDKTGTVPALTSLPCLLDEPTKHIIKLFVKYGGMTDDLQSLEIDTKRMPLGRVNKSQIVKGIEALEAIKDALENSKGQAILEELSSTFYTIIPHDFGRKVPPVITDKDTLQRKIIFLLVLGGIETIPGRQLMKDSASTVPGIPHKLDILHKSLNCNLTLLDPSSHEYQVISKCIVSTNCTLMIPNVLNVWRVDRQDQDDKFKELDYVENRRLLWWQGSLLQNLVTDLRSGQKIRLSGFFMGKGIFHSSVHNFSIHSAVCETGVCLMLLVEVALGKEYHVTQADQVITGPPAGFDSVVSVGDKTEPDPKDDTVLKIDGKDVKLSLGKPISPLGFTDSLLDRNEYVVYKENQTRIRFMMRVKFDRP